MSVHRCGRATLAGVFALLVLMMGSSVAAQSASGPVRVGMLPLGSPNSVYDLSLVESFRQGVRESGLVENLHVTITVAWVDGEADAARAVEDLIQRGAKVLVPCGTSASVAAKRGGGSLPILFISVGNPVGIGLVSSLARPAGNATGYSDDLADLAGKYVQFASQLGKPQAAVHYLWHSGWADGQYRLRATESAAQSVGIKLRPASFGDAAEMAAAMTAMKKAGATAIIVQPSPFTYRQRDRIIALAAELGLATIFAFPPAAREGALLAYGPDYADLYRRAGVSLDRILKGARPADTPVQLPSKFDLVLNLKTARALGLEIPRALRVQATETIE